MVNKKIIWSDRASEELKQILDYYVDRNQNTAYSLKLLDEIENLMLNLAENENIGRLTTDKNTRVIVMKVYLVFYEINQDQIEIVSFWDNTQNDTKRIDY